MAEPSDPWQHSDPWSVPVPSAGLTRVIPPPLGTEPLAVRPDWREVVSPLARLEGGCIATGGMLPVNLFCGPKPDRCCYCGNQETEFDCLDEDGFRYCPDCQDKTGEGYQMVGEVHNPWAHFQEEDDQTGEGYQMVGEVHNPWAHFQEEDDESNPWSSLPEPLPIAAAPVVVGPHSDDARMRLQHSGNPWCPEPGLCRSSSGQWGAIGSELPPARVVYVAEFQRSPKSFK
jgi:hypothetical protein